MRHILKDLTIMPSMRVMLVVMLLAPSSAHAVGRERNRIDPPVTVGLESIIKQMANTIWVEIKVVRQSLVYGKFQQNHVQSSGLYVSLTSERVTGASIICLYSYNSALYEFTVPSGDKCPSSIMIRK